MICLNEFPVWCSKCTCILEVSLYFDMCADYARIAVLASVTKQLPKKNIKKTHITALSTAEVSQLLYCHHLRLKFVSRSRNKFQY